VKKLDMFFS